MGAPATTPATPNPTTDIPCGSALVGLLETTVVVAQQLVKSTTWLWIRTVPSADQVNNDRIWPYHELGYCAFSPV